MADAEARCANRHRRLREISENFVARRNIAGRLVKHAVVLCPRPIAPFHIVLERLRRRRRTSSEGVSDEGAATTPFDRLTVAVDTGRRVDGHEVPPVLERRRRPSRQNRAAILSDEIALTKADERVESSTRMDRRSVHLDVSA